MKSGNSEGLIHNMQKLLIWVSSLSPSSSTPFTFNLIRKCLLEEYVANIQKRLCPRDCKLVQSGSEILPQMGLFPFCFTLPDLTHPGTCLSTNICSSFLSSSNPASQSLWYLAFISWEDKGLSGPFFDF